MFPVNTYHDYFGTTIDVLTTCYSYLIDIKQYVFLRTPKITQNQDKNHELGLTMGTVKVAITIDEEILGKLDRLVKRRLFPSRSRAIQAAVQEKL